MTAKKTGGLGRGLSALLGDATVDFEARKRNRNSSDPAHFMMIPLEQIKANPFQPRTHFEEEALHELAESIKIQGIISLSQSGGCRGIIISLYLAKEGFRHQK